MTIEHARRILPVMLTSFILISCSTMNVRDEMVKSDFDFSSYHTFDFGIVDVEADSGISVEDEASEVKEAVKKQMLFRGITQDHVRPELLVDISGSITQKVQTRRRSFASDPPTYIGQRRYSWKADTVVVGKYQQSNFHIKLLDSRSKAPVWNGLVDGVLPDNGRRKEKVIHQSIRELFEMK